MTMFVGPDHAGNLMEIGLVDGEDGPSSSMRCLLGRSTSGDANAPNDQRDH